MTLTPPRPEKSATEYPDTRIATINQTAQKLSGPYPALPLEVLFNLRNPILAFGHWLSSRNGLELNKLTGWRIRGLRGPYFRPGIAA